MKKGARLKLKISPGDYVEFFGNSMKIYGCVIRANDSTVDYIRDSISRWTADTSMVEVGHYITEASFIKKVKYQARINGAKMPSTEEIKSALEKFKLNFEIDMSEIRKILIKN